MDVEKWAYLQLNTVNILNIPNMALQIHDIVYTDMNSVYVDTSMTCECSLSQEAKPTPS